MANPGQKNGVYHIRFRFHGKEYRKSIGPGDAASADATKRSVELTLHRLLTGLIQVPAGVDPGAFILSGGTLPQPRKAGKSLDPPRRPGQAGRREALAWKEPT